MPIVFDYAAIRSAVTRPDGSIGFYARVAIADRDYKYLEPDGAIRKERISRKDLFDAASADSLRFLTVTNDHTDRESPNPDNYQAVSAGMTGEFITAGLDGHFLGVTASIKRRDAIEAFKAGKVEVSPGYQRDLYQQKAPHLADDGVLYQRNRKYFELALVDQARGGHDIRIKDGLADCSVFDPSQIDDDLKKLWLKDDGLDQAAIDRLLIHRTLSPPPIYLPTTTPQNMAVKFKIGNRELLIDESSVSDASDLKAEHQQLLAEKAAAATTQKDSFDIKAELAVTKTKLEEAQAALVAIKDSAAKMVQAEIASISRATQEIKLFSSAKNIKDAAELLGKGDMSGYRAAIVSNYYPTENQDAADIAQQYQSLAIAFAASQKQDPTNNRDMNALLGAGSPGGTARTAFTTESYQIANLVGAAQGSYEGLIAGNGGWPDMLPDLSNYSAAHKM
jgi:hypothetical protein